jgi:hypothetical protein
VLTSVRFELEEFVEPKEEPVDDGEVALEAAGSELLLLARELLPESEALEDDDAPSLEVEAVGAEAAVVEAEPLNGLAWLASVDVETEAEPLLLSVLLLMELDEAELDDGLVALPT